MSAEFTPEREAELFARIEARRDAGQLVAEHGDTATAIAQGRAEIAHQVDEPHQADHWQRVSVYADQILRRQARMAANDDPVRDGLELMRAFREISDPTARMFVVDLARLFAITECVEA